jgi:Zn-dependent protease with chaperone function
MSPLTLHPTSRDSRVIGLVTALAVGVAAATAIVRVGGPMSALQWCQDRLVTSLTADGAISVALGAIGASAALSVGAFIARETRGGVHLAASFAAQRMTPASRVDAARVTVAPAAKLMQVDDVRPFAVTVGLLRPVIVLSSGLVSRCSLAELRAVIAHEEAHRRARDPLRAVCWEVLRRVAAPFPSVGDITEHLSVAREMAADARARAVVGRRALASALLKATGDRSFPFATAHFGTLGDRARALLVGSSAAPLRLGPWRLAVTATSLVAAFGLALGAAAQDSRGSPDLCASDVPAMSQINFSPYLEIRLPPPMSTMPGRQEAARP